MAKTTRGESGAQYNPADFIIPGSDHQGHSERVQCRMQPFHKRQIEVLVASGMWPFRTDGDLMRWAVIRGLRSLELMEPSMIPKGFMAQADAIHRLMQDHIYQQKFQEMFQKMQEVVNGHMALGQQGEAIILVSDIKSKLEEIQGEPNWKLRSLQQLQERFGHLLKQRGVSLRQLSDEDETVLNQRKSDITQ